MPTPISNQFTSYKLSAREELEGSILNQLQKQVIQNELSLIAAQKMALDYDPHNPISYAQTEAMLKGQLQVYQLMLDKSEAAEASMMEQVLRQSQS